MEFLYCVRYEFGTNIGHEFIYLAVGDVAVYCLTPIGMDRAIPAKTKMQSKSRQPSQHTELLAQSFLQ